MTGVDMEFRHPVTGDLAATVEFEATKVDLTFGHVVEAMQWSPVTNPCGNVQAA